MKSILSVLLAAMLLIGVLGGCARDMSGESRATPAPAGTAEPTAAPEPTEAPAPTETPADTTADGVIDEGMDAVDGVVGAGEEAVNDIVDAGEDIVDGVTGSEEPDAPTATPAPTADR